MTAIKYIGERNCWYETTTEDASFSCHRTALVGRLLCHKHAGMKARLMARRAKNKVAKASRKVNR